MKIKNNSRTMKGLAVLDSKGKRTTVPVPAGAVIKIVGEPDLDHPVVSHWFDNGELIEVDGSDDDGAENGDNEGDAPAPRRAARRSRR